MRGALRPFGVRTPRVLPSPSRLLSPGTRTPWGSSHPERRLGCKSAVGRGRRAPSGRTRLGTWLGPRLGPALAPHRLLLGAIWGLLAAASLACPPSSSAKCTRRRQTPALGQFPTPPRFCLLGANSGFYIFKWPGLGAGRRLSCNLWNVYEISVHKWSFIGAQPCSLFCIICGSFLVTRAKLSNCDR